MVPSKTRSFTMLNHSSGDWIIRVWFTEGGYFRETCRLVGTPAALATIGVFVLV